MNVWILLTASILRHAVLDFDKLLLGSNFYILDVLCVQGILAILIILVIFEILVILGIFKIIRIHRNIWNPWSPFYYLAVKFIFILVLFSVWTSPWGANPDQFDTRDWKSGETSQIKNSQVYRTVYVRWSEVSKSKRTWAYSHIFKGQRILVSTIDICPLFIIALLRICFWSISQKYSSSRQKSTLLVWFWNSKWNEVQEVL